MHIEFFTDSDEMIEAVEADQVPPVDSGISINAVKYRVAWIEWLVQGGKLDAIVFLKRSDNPQPDHKDT